MARTNISTRSEIITEGLELGGNPELTSRAQLFLNFWLDELYAAYNWPWLLKEESITVSNSTIDVSTLNNTFRAAKAIRLEDDNRELAEYVDGFVGLRIRLLRDADSESSSGGKPRYFATDPDSSNDQIYVYPKPDKSYSGTIWYYYQPAKLSDDGAVPVLPSAMLAVSAVAAFAAKFDGSNLLAILDSQVKQALRMLRANQGPDGIQRMPNIPFDKNVTRYRHNE